MSRREARRLARVLRRAGHAAVFAGGAVRDRLLGLRGGDIDIATSAAPEQVMALFPRTVAVGQAFGVVKVITAQGQFDVATFRQDVGIADGRHPLEVRPATLDQDVLRRDFSINGLVEDPETGEITDLVGGRADLAAGVVRAIGEPAERFREDALRLLRAVRFAARFGFRIEAGTGAAMRDHARRLELVSGERVRDELSKMLVPRSRRRAIELLDEHGLLEVILPELPPMKGCEQPPEYHPEGDVWIHTLLALEKLPARVSFELGLGLLLHDVGKPPTARRAADRIRFDGHVELGAQMAGDICTRLRLSRASAERVVALVRDHLLFKDVPAMRPARLRRLMAEAHWPELLVLYRADVAASHGRFEALPAIRAMQKQLRGAAAIPPPLLAGSDMLALGVPPGPRVGALLRAAADLQLEGELADREAALAWLSVQLNSAERI